MYENIRKSLEITLTIHTNKDMFLLDVTFQQGGTAMLVTERHDRILHTLEKDGQVFVSRLSADFQVSEETIRRDLEKLEEEGYARRCYGGATFTGSMDLPFTVRKKSHVSGKRRLAAAAADLIPDGASIALDESTTATFVAEALKEKKELTVITTSMETVLLLSDKEDWTVLLTGGKLKPKNLSMTGPRVLDFIREYAIDWTIVSCAGMNSDRGIFDPTEDNAGIKRVMLDAAEHTILAVDKYKFERKSFSLICPFSSLDYVVTDEQPDEEWRAAFAKNHVELICAE